MKNTIEIFKLSRGMTRVFIVLAISVFFLSLQYRWNDVREAQKWRDNLLNGVTITAISKTASSSPNREVTSNPPANISVGFGFATYLCLASIGHTVFINDYREANTNLPVEEIMPLINAASFKECVSDTVHEANSKLLQQKIYALALSILSIFILYFGLLIFLIVGKWIIRGFRPNF